MLLSFVIPCYNEQDNVVLLAKEIERVFADRAEEYELVFVDDGSNDSTLANLNELYSAVDNIQILSFSRNFGKESAMYAGLSNARGDMACIIDSDMQQKPELVLDMLDILNSNPSLDCVTAYQEKRKEGKLISAIKSGFYKTINKMSDLNFVDGASDFRLMRRSMVDAIVSMTEYHRFSKGIFSWVGFNIEYIPYEVAPRANGDTKWSTKKLIKYAIDGIFSFSTFPLKIATYTGITTSILAVLYLISVVIEKLCFGIVVRGYATIVVLILFLGGIQLFGLGILGEYISKMFVQTKNRPIYILKSHKKK